MDVIIQSMHVVGLVTYSLSTHYVMMEPFVHSEGEQICSRLPTFTTMSILSCQASEINYIIQLRLQWLNTTCKIIFERCRACQLPRHNRCNGDITAEDVFAHHLILVHITCSEYTFTHCASCVTLVYGSERSLA